MNKLPYFLEIFALNIKLTFGMDSFRNIVNRIKKFKKPLDQGGKYVALLIDLSKAFDCLLHGL